MGKIYYLMGKSASGKDTIYKRLLAECPNLRPMVPYTTRPMREGEEEGVEYHFISRKELEEYRQLNKVIEVRTYDTSAGPWSYATIDGGNIKKEKWDYLTIGTLESYEKLRDYFDRDMVIPLYLETDDGIRLERALLRERSQKKPNYVEMCRRFLADENDFSLEKLKSCGINKIYQNICLDSCLGQIKSDIKAME